MRCCCCLQGGAANNAAGGSAPMFFMGNPGDYAWGREGLDSVITQMLNQMENSGPPPMDKAKIQDIQRIEISDEQVSQKLQCSVCWDDFERMETVRKLPCTVRHHTPNAFTHFSLMNKIRFLFSFSICTFLAYISWKLHFPMAWIAWNVSSLPKNCRQRCNRRTTKSNARFKYFE